MSRLNDIKLLPFSVFDNKIVLITAAEFLAKKRKDDIKIALFNN